LKNIPITLRPASALLGSSGTAFDVLHIMKEKITDVKKDVCWGADLHLPFL